MKKLTKIRLKYLIILIIILIVYVFLTSISVTFMRYYMEVNGTAVGYGAVGYQITYILDGGTNPAGQVADFDASDLPIALLPPTKEGYNFQGWYLNSEFSGDPVTTISSLGNYTLYAEWTPENMVAEVNGVYYETVNEAIYKEVPTDGTPTTVRILKNVVLDYTGVFNASNRNTYNGRITVKSGQNVILDIQNYTLGQSVATPIIETDGTITISNGTITNSSTQGAINVNSTGTLYVTGGTITATGTKQAIYNNGGTVYISGNPVISNTSNSRAAVHNEKGNMTITGGTITSTRFSAVKADAGSLTIGTKDQNVSKTVPNIRGTYGVTSSINYNFYDGILKGKTAAVNDQSKITDIETDCEIASGSEVISGTTYKTIYLIAESVTVTFNPTGGTVDEPTRLVEENTAIGPLPTPQKEGYVFAGWYTDPDEGEGEIVRENRVITEDVEFFAHWLNGAVKMDNTWYATLEDAIAAAPNNVSKTIILYTDVNINANYTSVNVGGQIKIPKNKIITLDIQDHILGINNDITAPIIVNSGNLTIINGTITTNSTHAAINNTGTLTISGGDIIATGTRQAVYNDGGDLTITGTANLSAASSERATVQNSNNGTTNISGGTITSTGYYAISNQIGTTGAETAINGVINITGGTITSTAESAVNNSVGTLTIGSSGGNVVQVPVIRGAINGINNSSTLNIYDGLIYGITNSIVGTVTNVESGYHIANGVENIGGQQYNKAYLEIDE